MHALENHSPRRVTALTLGLSLSIFSACPISEADAKCGREKAGPDVFSVRHNIGPTYRLIFGTDDTATVDVRSKYKHVATVTKIPTDGYFTAWKVDVELEGKPGRWGYPFRCNFTSTARTWHDDDGFEDNARVRSIRYVFDPEKSSPAGGPVELREQRSLSRHFICARVDYIAVQPSIEAPAYRIEWAETLADFEAGKRKMMVLPTMARGTLDRKSKS